MLIKNNGATALQRKVARTRSIKKLLRMPFCINGFMLYLNQMFFRLPRAECRAAVRKLVKLFYYRTYRCWYLFKYCVHFLFVFVNSIRFATYLNQMSCNRGKTDDEINKSKRKCFFQQKYFWSELKTLANFSGVSFVEKYEGTKCRNRKNLIIKTSSFCFVFLASPELKK